MLAGWRSSAAADADPENWPHRAPDGRRLYAIGDIHGREDLLRKMQTLIQEDARAHRDKQPVVIYLGDYVDRGMHSREVIDRLLSTPLPGFETVHLLGNHEAFMLDFTATVETGMNWLHNGGNTTLASYGVRPGVKLTSRRALVDLHLAFRDALPGEHLRFLRGLDLFHREGDYLFVHAGIRPGLPLQRQNADDLIWIRDDFLRAGQTHEAIVVHGHSIRETVDWRANRIGIDTGAYQSNKLTAVVLDGQDVRFIQT